MKRIWLCVVASLCLIFAACFAFSASAAEVVASGTCGVNGNNLTWTLTDDVVLEIGGSGDMRNYSHSSLVPWDSYRENITTAIIGDGVTSIGSSAFEDCTSLVNVTIGNSVTSIGSSAFRDCDSLENVTIGNSVTSIGSYAFYYCDNIEKVYITDLEAWCKIDFYDSGSNPLYCGADLYLNGEILTDLIIPDTITAIEDYAFCNCDSLENVTIPDSVTSIGSYAFYHCDSLENVTIGNSVTSIDSYAFYHCDSLENVTIGNGITTITSSMLDSCYNLETITIPQSVTSIAGGAFDSEKIIIYGFTGSTADSYASSNSIPFVSLDGFMPNYIDGGQCGNNAYWELYRNGKMIITGTGKLYNETITTSPYVRSVEIASGVTNIGSGAFGGSYGLTNITIPDSVTSIGSNAFQNCDSLENVTIGNSVTSIGSYAFYHCGSLENVTIGNSVTSIGSYAFYDCDSLVNVTIGNSVTSIDSYAFFSCNRLENVTIGNSVTSIGSCAFVGCNSLKKVHISSINSWMNITFGDNYSNPLSYGADLYLDGERFTNLTIPNDITKVKNYAFYNCKSLKTITVPKTVTSIPDNAFTGCTNATIYGYANTCAETTARANILPFVALDEGWQPKLSYNGKCGNNVMWQLYQDGRLVLGFMNNVTSDVIYDYTASSAPTWNAYASLVRTVDFPKGITRVGDYAFDKLTGIVTVNYGGDDALWETIDFGASNVPLEKAYVIYGENSTVHINYKDVLKTTAKVNGKVIPVIINLETGTTWQELKANLIYSDYTDVIVFDHDGKLIGLDDALSTGYILHHINKDGAVIEELLISVSGDVTGDSVVNIDDIQNIAAHLAGDDNSLNKIAIDKNLDDVLTMEEFNKFIATFR